MKLIDQRNLLLGLKMTSKAVAMRWVVFGMALFLFSYLFLVYSENTTITTWKVILTAACGTVFVGLMIFIFLDYLDIL